jgi:Mn2+/Fe2+ NRAMP family transporter
VIKDENIMATNSAQSQAAGVTAVDASVPARELRLTALLGPGLIVAAAGIGSGDVVSATVGGATYGVTLLWAIALGAFFKFVLTEGIARWQLATGQTLLEGWAIHLPAWVKVYFGLYLVLWTFAVTAALTNATGLGIANLTGGAIPQSWGAVGHSFIGAAFVLVGGFAGFDKAIKVLVGVMGFSVLACAALTFTSPVETMQGLVPTIPAGAGVYVLSLVGGIGGSITMLGYSYWMREEKIAGPACLKFVRGDLSVAYVFTALFGMAVMLISHRAFFLSGTQLSDAQAVSRMADMLGSILGPFGFWAYAVGFWACVFASLLGVWQSVPYLYADFYGAVKKAPDEERRRLTQVTSVPYRLALLFVTLAPLPFAFMGRPLFIIVTYTVIGSLFIPFLAATLLYMNSRVRWGAGVPHNHWTTNALLVVILLLFVAVGAREVIAAF